MARKDQKKSRKDQYRDILEKIGILYDKCRVLAFTFERTNGPENFHFCLMMDDRRPKYYLFDWWDKIAQVIIPNDDAIAEIICEIAKNAEGKKVTPNLT